MNKIQEYFRLECKWDRTGWHIAHPSHEKMTKQKWKSIEKLIRGWSHSWRIVEIKEQIKEEHNKL